MKSAAIAAVCAVLFGTLGSAGFAVAQTTPAAEAPPAATTPAPAPKDAALAWIDQYRTRQALFHDKDLERLRERVAAGSDADAQAWLDRTTAVRQVLEDPKWQETERWLRDFLRVQAIYTDEQIDQLRSDAKLAAKESAQQLTQILAGIEAQRTRLREGSQGAAQMREQQTALMQAFRQDAVQQRLAAQAAAELQRAQAPVLPQQPVQPPVFVRPRPLVDSLDYARWSIMRDFWRPVYRAR